ncbi:hypothetical protein D3C81_1141130 [compost metagenome]
MRAGRQAAFPQLLAVFHVVGAQVLVEGAAEETDATSGGEGAAQAWHAHAQRDRNRRAVTHGAVLVHPDFLMGRQVDCSDITPRWRLARQAHWRQQRFKDHTVRRAFVRLHAFGFAFARALGSDFGGRDHFRFERHVARVHESDLAHRVNRDAAPVEHAEVTRIHDRTLQRWRGERAVVTHGFEVDPADQLVERRNAPHVALLQRRRHQVQVGFRLGRRGVVAFHRALRHRHFIDRHDGLAGAAVQHVDAALLGGGQNRLLDAVSGFQVHQGWLAAHVHVP